MYKQILVPIDLNEEHSWTKPLALAGELAKAHGARLHVMTVVPDFGMAMVSQYFPPGYEAQMRASAAEKLAEITAKAAGAGQAVEHHVAEGSIYREILAAAERLGIDLIVMQSHRPEVSDYLLGANAARVVRHATCSVLVVRG